MDQKLHEAHEHLLAAVNALTEVYTEKWDEFARPIVKDIIVGIGDDMKKLTIVETYTMCESSGLCGPQYDSIFERMYEFYKESIQKEKGA